MVVQSGVAVRDAVLPTATLLLNSERAVLCQLAEDLSSRVGEGGQRWLLNELLSDPALAQRFPQCFKRACKRQDNSLAARRSISAQESCNSPPRRPAFAWPWADEEGLEGSAMISLLTRAEKAWKPKLWAINVRKVPQLETKS
jgi:hypothetical protein